MFYYVNNAFSALFKTKCCQHMILHFMLLLCICPFAHYTCIDFILCMVQRDCTVCVARLGFSTVYVTLCLRYSMYWFPRYNVSFRQHFCVRQGQGQGHNRTLDQDQGQGHLSNSDDEGGVARRRVPRRTSSEIASAKIAGRPIPVKVRAFFNGVRIITLAAAGYCRTAAQCLGDLKKVWPHWT